MPADELDIARFARVVIDALEAAEIEYLLGGSMALWAWGGARSTMDVDLVVRIPDDHVEILCGELMKRRMMVPPDIVRELIADPEGDLAINAIDPFSGFKAELFPLRSRDALRASALQRRVLVRLKEPIGPVYVHSPEDLIIYKLQYYSISRQTKHDRDIASILASGHALDTAYIEHWAARLGLLDIWRELAGR